MQKDQLEDYHKRQAERTVAQQSGESLDVAGKTFTSFQQTPKGNAGNRRSSKDVP